MILEGSYSNGYEVCLCSDGTFFSPGYHTSAAVLKESISFSWGTFNETLIDRGQRCTIKDSAWASEIYARTEIGMVCPLEYYVLTAGTGIRENGISLYTEQDIFKSLGCQYARDLDGGASTALVIDGVCIRDSVDVLMNNAAGRPVPDFLAFF